MAQTPGAFKDIPKQECATWQKTQQYSTKKAVVSSMYQQVQPTTMGTVGIKSRFTQPGSWKMVRYGSTTEGPESSVKDFPSSKGSSNFTCPRREEDAFEAALSHPCDLHVIACLPQIKQMNI
jgi:hypothetical protein